MSIRTQHQQSLSDDLETDDFHNLVCIFKLKPPHQYHRRQLEIINEVSMLAISREGNLILRC